MKNNLTREQRDTLFELRSNEKLRFSIADKTSEFVVMTTEAQIKTTQLHVGDTSYKKLDIPSNEKEITQFIANLTVTIEEKVNKLWKTICVIRNLSNKVYDLLSSQHTLLQTGRI